MGVSHDGGQTWTQSSLPAIPGSPFTFGDPAVTVDRQGNFYYASLGANAAGQSLVFVSKSADRGRSFQPGVTVAIDPGSDKEWIAAGPDPLRRGAAADARRRSRPATRPVTLEPYRGREGD